MANPDFTAPPTLRVVTPKPKMTIYYALLIISLCAMLTACLFLYLEIRRFGGFGVVQGRVSALERPASGFRHNEVGVGKEVELAAAGSAASLSSVATFS